jgi:pre-60S factor REI1
VEEVDSDEWDEDGNDEIPPNDCLFCTHHSSNMDKNLVHMSEKHSFFLPDLEFVVDLDSLVSYLGAKVGQGETNENFKIIKIIKISSRIFLFLGRMCLWCNERSKRFRTVDAVRKHMVAKGHCKMAFAGGDSIAEFADFYDYSKTHPDCEGGTADNDPDMEVDLDALDDTGYELVLPSGAKIGHRSLVRYYKQSLNPNRELVLRKPNARVLNHYQSFGWVGSTGPEAKKRAHDVKYFQIHQQKLRLKLGTKANKFQKYWRDPTGMIG